MKQILQAFLLMLIAIPTSMSAEDNWETAVPIADGETITGEYMDRWHKVDWYKIELPADGKITLQAIPQGTLDFSELALYAANQDPEADDKVIVRQQIGLEKRDTITLVVEDCKAGIYWARLARRYNMWDLDVGGYGIYSISYDFVEASLPNDAEPNDIWEEASVMMKNGDTVTGHLGYSYYAHRADMDKEDWYKIEVPADGSVVLTTTSFGTMHVGDIALYVQDAEDTNKYLRKNVSFTDSVPTLSLSVEDCKAGLYYVKVAQRYNMWIYNGCGSYQLNYQFVPTSLENDAEPNDTWELAKKLMTPGDTLTGHLGYYYSQSNDVDREDWYQIRVPEDGGVVKLTTTSLGSMYVGDIALYVQDAEDTNKFLRKSVSFTDSVPTLSLSVEDCKAGLYYVRVAQRYNMWIYNGCGSYQLVYDFTSGTTPNDQEPNDNTPDAIALKPGQTVTGQLGYYYYSNASDRDIEDWYKVVVDQPQTLTFTASVNAQANLQAFVQMYGKDKEWLGYGSSFDSFTGEVTYEYEAKNAGTYYLCVGRAVNVWADTGWGGYTLTFQNNGEELPPVVATVTTAASGYATFYDSKNSYQLPAGLEAKVVTGMTSSTTLSYVTLSGNVIPKGVAVMLAATPRAAATYTLTSTTTEASYTGENLLHGSDVATTTTGDGDCYFYKLSYGAAGTALANWFAWYPANQSKGAFTSDAHKAWLAIPTSLSTRGFIAIDEDDSTGIEAVIDAGDAGAEVWFDLQGRSIEKPTAPGIYIRNNKKVIIK